MEKELEIDTAATLLKLLGDKTRLSMLSLLSKSDFCVCEFVEIYQMSQPAISQHLRKLKDIGLVKESRKSQWIIYSLNRDSTYFNLLNDILKFLPDQNDKLVKKDSRITCS